MNDEGKMMGEDPQSKASFKFNSNQRVYRVLLDQNQYKIDSDRLVSGEIKENVYTTFNLFVRRRPKENNFKAILESIRELMNTKFVVPDWLRDLILGYGDPASAHYTQLAKPAPIPTLDFHDTFLSYEHLQASFPNHELKLAETAAKIQPPFKLTFTDLMPKENGHSEDENKVIHVQPYKARNMGPYENVQAPGNRVRFTPAQVEAIKSGTQPGLTIVIGPPGTGKTDVAVQIISNIYQNFPDQKTLIVTHSNQALNQLFEKIMHLNIDERHLLRLGHGEESLETEKDFSRYGRVNYVLGKRLELLDEVDRLQKSFAANPDDEAAACETAAYSCETAIHFYLNFVLPKWEVYASRMRKLEHADSLITQIEESFPFKHFFANAPQPLFKRASFAEDYEIAKGCFRYVKKMFKQLEEFRAFELIRNGADRAQYLLVKEAKIIAMTCTHAALKRQDLVKFNFRYDNILMEESAQILEIETFLPLLLQNPDHNGNNRLKRWIMIGDHNQLPPIIKNVTFQKYSNMEQSLFTRFVKLGIPTVDLDAQGRCRPTLCDLFRWRYKNLGDLSHVSGRDEFRSANAGFVHDYQLVNVDDFNGQGESEPQPFFYQNVAEAEYIVAVFMYMRMIGYSADSITILSTYNGQKQLIRDILKKRCVKNPLIGMPKHVTTVDKFQGSQNDIILLSLVKTKNIGHLRDVRRLIVAMSRARLGLYIFARVQLFKSCFELTPVFNILLKRPTKLCLVSNELYPCKREV
jgi:intron-binding protein aquarius